MPTPRLAFASGLAAILLAAFVGSASAVTVGIADQKPDMFNDARFTSLGLRAARINVAWDALRVPADTAALDAWMRAARAHGVQPLITIDRSRTARHRAPSVAEYATQVRALHARYPFVRDWSAWNEANHYGQPTGRKPRLAARYWLALRKACAGCRVLGADLLDQPNMVKWVRAFQRAAHRRPAQWGLHNYVDANRLRTTGTRRLLRATHAQIWLTETGGLVTRRNGSATKLAAGPAHAAKVTRFILTKLVRLSPRIARVYLYHWNANAAALTWDSGFVGPDGNARPALGVLRGFLHR